MAWVLHKWDKTQPEAKSLNPLPSFSFIKFSQKQRISILPFKLSNHSLFFKILLILMNIKLISLLAYILQLGS